MSEIISPNNDRSQQVCFSGRTVFSPVLHHQSYQRRISEIIKIFSHSSSLLCMFVQNGASLRNKYKTFSPCMDNPYYYYYYYYYYCLYCTFQKVKTRSTAWLKISVQTIPVAAKWSAFVRIRHVKQGTQAMSGIFHEVICGSSHKNVVWRKTWM